MTPSAILFLAALGSMAFVAGAEPTPGLTNIALGKPYSMEPAPTYAHCTDPDDSRQLTDGLFTTGYFWTQKSTVGWQGRQPAMVTIDLGRVEPICGVSLNTAAGAGGVTWPSTIYVLVSDDGKEFREAGELAGKGGKAGSPPSSGYAVHRFWTDNFRVHGRYVMVVAAGGSYFFTDEIEVFRGDQALLSAPLAGEAIKDPKKFFQARQVPIGVERRIRLDAQAVREMLTNSVISAEVRGHVERELAQADAELANLPQAYDDSFLAVLPLNAVHARVFRAQAAAWRAASPERLTIWQTSPWDPLSPVHLLPKADKSAVSVALMQNEHRAATFNISDSADSGGKWMVRITGLPGGENPSWIRVHEVQWTDTRTGIPVAAALPEAQKGNGGFEIHTDAGLTRQVWLSFHPVDVPAGLHKGKIVLAGGVEIPLSVRIYPMRFPEKPSLHLGGWDYTDGPARFDITAENLPLVVAHLRERMVDSPWATSGVFPAGAFDDQGNFNTVPDTKSFDEWVARWPDAGRYCVFMSVTDQFAGTKIGAPQFEKRVGEWIRFWAKHAQSRGIRPGQIALLLVDEPAKPEQDAIILAWSKALHAAGTGVKVWEDPIHADPATANQEMIAACDVLCPNRVKFLTNPQVRNYWQKQRPQNAELAFYSCSGPMRLLDPYTYVRLQAWTCWKEGAKSSYFWAFSDSGGGSSWNEYAARGPAYLPFFFDKTSVTPGKHMEAIRESAEDYEYLVVLRDAVEKLRQTGSNPALIADASRLLERGVSRVLDAKDASSLTWAAPKDRTIADQVRLEILECLARLKEYR